MGPSHSSEKLLVGKVAVVTGASMGIGEAIARIFVEHGAQVVMLARDAVRLEAARARIGHSDQTLALTCDVRHREEIDRAIGLIVHHFQRIDIWVNNAGHGLLDSIANVKMTDVRETLETNLFGALEGMKAVIPIMKQQGSGAIINISSVAGHIPLPFHAIYSATKFSMNAIGKAARIELAGSGINVLTVCPGYVRTDFGANAIKGDVRKQVRPSSVRGISAVRVARATLNGYLAGKREVIVPWTMHPVVKLYQLFPGLVEWGMRRMAR
jgi:short-subunit dehydrogenase